MKFFFIAILLSPFLLFSQMKENGIAPGLSAVFANEETGINLRAHYFPSHKMCFGIETNFFSKKLDLHRRVENMEITLNGHFIFRLNEHFGVYPLIGLGWKRAWIERDDTSSLDTGFRALCGGGIHGSFNNFAPYFEYIYGAGSVFESEGIFILGTFFTIPFNHENK